jgi:transcriptional regulator GlxA family with amidase domain
LHDLAAQAHVSARHLSRLFSQHAGIGVVAYQQELRIARAKELLSKVPVMSGEKVSALCWFGSTRDFRRVWQRFSEGTPGDALRAKSIKR